MSACNGATFERGKGRQAAVALGLALCFLMALAVCSFAATEADKAKGMVEKAAAYVKANGKDKALEEFNKPKNQFVDGEFYVFVYDMSATIVAHPINPKLVGKNLMEVPDAGGKLFRKSIVETAKAKGSGWVDYRYKNPQNNKIEEKTTYLQKVGEIIVCCGAYK